MDCLTSSLASFSVCYSAIVNDLFLYLLTAVVGSFGYLFTFPPAPLHGGTAHLVVQVKQIGVIFSNICLSIRDQLPDISVWTDKKKKFHLIKQSLNSDFLCEDNIHSWRCPLLADEASLGNVL